MGEVFWVNKLFSTSGLKRGDIVCFPSPYESTKVNVKRIVGLVPFPPTSSSTYFY